MASLAILPSLAAFLVVIHTVVMTQPVLVSAARDESSLSNNNASTWPDDLTDQVHDESWPNFEEATTRWSTYEAPTFDLVFIPESEEDLARGLEYMSAAKLPYLAKSGGHGFSPTLQAMEALPDDYSAFPHRGNFHNQYLSMGVYTDESLAGIVDNFWRGWRDRFAGVSEYDWLYIYQNYAHDDEPLSAIYGYEEWHHERLTDLKNRYDPHGFFSGYHAIPSDPAEWS